MPGVTSFLFIGVNSSRQEDEVGEAVRGELEVFCQDVRYLLTSGGNKVTVMHSLCDSLQRSILSSILISCL